MDEREVREVLRELPRVRPSAGFASRVAGRIRSNRAPRRGARVFLPAVAAAAAFAFAAGIRIEAVRKDRAIRRETRALAREIREMKRTLPSPVIELGEENGVRYVIDLRRLPGRRDGVL